jgi:hypothetical protein
VLPVPDIRAIEDQAAHIRDSGLIFCDLLTTEGTHPAHYTLQLIQVWVPGVLAYNPEAIRVWLKGLLLLHE